MEIIHVVLVKEHPNLMEDSNRTVFELATQQALAKEKVSVWVIGASINYHFPWSPFVIESYQKPISPFGLDRNLRKSLENKNGNTIFHLHGGLIPFFYSLGIELNKKNLPFVFSPHDSYSVLAFQKSGWKKKIYFQWFERKLLKYASAIHCHNKLEKEGLEILYPNSKAILIPYGYEAFTHIKHAHYSREFIIGFSGYLDIYSKGLDLLLKAFSLFNKQVPLSELWIIGDGPEGARLEEMAVGLDISKNISFWANQSNEEKLGLLQQLHVFAHPSRVEGIPEAVLEAASTGIPCVVTKATKVGEFIQEYNCGEVIDRPDHKILFEAFKKVYTSIHQNGRSALAENAQRMIREIFNWRTILQRFHQMYKRA